MTTTTVTTSIDPHSLEGVPPCLMSEIVKDLTHGELISLIRAGSVAILDYIRSPYYVESKPKGKQIIINYYSDPIYKYTIRTVTDEQILGMRAYVSVVFIQENPSYAYVTSDGSDGEYTRFCSLDDDDCHRIQETDSYDTEEDEAMENIEYNHKNSSILANRTMRYTIATDEAAMIQCDNLDFVTGFLIMHELIYPCLQITVCDHTTGIITKH